MMAQYIGFKRNSANAGVLPTTATNGGRSARRRIPEGQTCSGNLKLTILCGVVTVLVFRGTIGVTYFSSLPDPKNPVHNEDTDRVVAEIRSGYGLDDSDSDAVVTNSNGSYYSLGPRITNWDRTRRKWLHENRGFPSYIDGKPRILLVTGSQPNPCDNPIGDHYLLKSIKNKMDYCRMHNMEIVYNMAHLDEELSGYWSKLPLMRKLLVSHPEVEWLWWMDSDAFFTDMNFEVPISKYVKHNLVVHGYPDLLFNEKSWIALNTGSFLLRNSQWSLDLLDSWAEMGPKGHVREEAGKILTANLKGRPAFEADDQSALIYLLLTRRDEWMERVFLESSYYLHGFWEQIVDRYDDYSRENDGRPFVTHFVGCKPCGGRGDYSSERCLKSMGRAFNFADNQLLKMFGFRHKGLSSPNVKRIRNETTRPIELVEEFRITSAVHGGRVSQQ